MAKRYKAKKKASIIQSIWAAFRARSLFAQLSLLIMVLAVFLLGTVITTQQIFRNFAAERTFATKTGTGQEGFVSIGDPEIVDLKARSVTIHWVSSQAMKVEVKYWPDNFWYGFFPFLPTRSYSDYEYTTDHVVTLTEGLKPNKRYNYKIESSFPNGEGFTSFYFTFTTTKT